MRAAYPQQNCVPPPRIRPFKSRVLCQGIAAKMTYNKAVVVETEKSSKDIHIGDHISSNHEHKIGFDGQPISREDQISSDQSSGQTSNEVQIDDVISINHVQIAMDENQIPWLPHCLVEEISSGKATVIMFCDDPRFGIGGIIRAKITFEQGKIYRVYEYSSTCVPTCCTTESSLERASRYVNQDTRVIPITNDCDFVMYCKRGTYCTWEKVARQSLHSGDHISYLEYAIVQHAIVQQVTGTEVSCYKNTLWGVEKGLVLKYKTFNRAVYNVICSSDEVLRKAESRLGEKEYHPFNNNDRHFAEWCKIGLSVGYFRNNRKGTNVVRKELLLPSVELKEGDHIAWARLKKCCVVYDHHALVKGFKKKPNKVEVREGTKNPANNEVEVCEVTQDLENNEVDENKNHQERDEPEVYEFTTMETQNKCCKICKLCNNAPKTIKVESKPDLLNGEDPVYKVIHFPALDPQQCLQEARKQVGEVGGYNLITNNCENFAANLHGCPPQVQEVFSYFPIRLATLLPAVLKFATLPLLEIAADAVVENGMFKIVLSQALNVMACIIPLAIEVGFILWDIKHDYRDHVGKRVGIGLFGFIITLSILLILALLPYSFSWKSILIALASLVIGTIGSLITTCVTRYCCRQADLNKYMKAYNITPAENKKTSSKNQESQEATKTESEQDTDERTHLLSN